MKTDPNTTGPDGSVLVLCPKCEGRHVRMHKTAGHDAYLRCDDCGHVFTLAEMRGTDGD
jgi:uncharacterized Zn finger protein